MSLNEKVSALMQARADVARLTKEIAEDLGVTTASPVAAPVKPAAPAKFVTNSGNHFARYQAVVGATKKGLSLSQIETETGIPKSTASMMRAEAYKKGDLKRAK